MNLTVVMELHTTPLQVLDPVETGILNVWRKALLYFSDLHIRYKHTGSVLIADILLESCRHKPYTTLGQRSMCLLLVHPEVRISVFVFVEEEVAKRRMMQTERAGLIFRDTQVGMQILVSVSILDENCMLVSW